MEELNPLPTDGTPVIEDGTFPSITKAHRTISTTCSKCYRKVKHECIFQTWEKEAKISQETKE